MLNVNASRLWDEVQAAIIYREKVTKLSAERKRQYAQNFMDGFQPAKDQHENTPFEIVTNWVPDLIYHNPAVDVSTSQPGIADEVVETLGPILNKLIQDIDLATPLDEVACDVQFDFGITMVCMEPVPGYQDDFRPTKDDQTTDGEGPSDELLAKAAPLRPRVVRVSPTRFFCDPMATSFENARFMGHSWIRDKDDLLNATHPDGTPIFNKDQVEGLGTDIGLEHVYDKDLYPTTPGDNANPRNQIVGYEIYVRETGKIYTLAYSPPSASQQNDDDEQTKAVFLREPRDYYGHPSGPYQYFFIHRVPDMLFPLAPIAAADDLSTELSTHLGQIKEDAGRAKSFVLVDGMAKGMTEIVPLARNGGVYAVDGLKDTVMKVELGGPVPAQMEYVQHVRNDLDRRIGLTNVQRGQTDPNITATADAIADKSADKRVRYAQAKFRKSVTRVLEAIAWLIWHSDQFIYSAMVKGQDGNEESVTFMGGENEDESQPSIPFDSLQISIEPYSMEYVDEATRQRRAMQVVELTMKIVPALVQLPMVEAENLLDDLFQANNIRGGARRYINMDVLNMLRQQFMQMQQMQMQATAMQMLNPMGAPQGMQPGMDQGIGGPPMDGGAGGGTVAPESESGTNRLGGFSEVEYDPVSQRLAQAA